jgi:hypothetical protein
LRCPDDNDRRRAPGRSRAAAALFHARLLLPFGSLFSLAAVPACVIPLAPDFQDPVASPGGPPYFYSSDPLPGATVTMANNTFTVTPADPNINATLYLRWIANYPSTNGDADDVQDNTIEPNGQVVRPTTDSTKYTFDCLQVLLDGTQWSIAAALSDLPFKPNNFADPTVNTEGTTVAIRTWTLVQTCMRSH